MSMAIPAGYAILTTGLVVACIVLLIAAGWSQRKLAVLAALGFCTLTSVFVIDVVSDGTAMTPRLALTLVTAGAIMIAPLVVTATKPKRREAKLARAANPPDATSRRSAVG